MDGNALSPLAPDARQQEARRKREEALRLSQERPPPAHTNSEAFRQAVREAFAALPDRERHLLRLHFADQLSTTELGQLFQVNQSTASRWLKSARQTVYEETKLRLQARLGLSTGEFQSFLAVLDSRLNVSMSQIFGEEDALSRNG